MMGMKLWVVGLTLIIAVPALGVAPALPWALVGAIIAIIGCVLVVLDR